MSVFKSEAVIASGIKDLEPVARDVEAHFASNGFQVAVQKSAGGSFISLSKGGTFKSVLGMKSALNISLYAGGSEVTVNASVGIFGQQLIPSVISMFIAWPVLISQIMGMVSQSKLDDEAIRVIRESILHHEADRPEEGAAFCTACGAKNLRDMAYCGKCGAKLE
jgi:uncharacterized paraquat-inducible protein A